MGAEWRRYDMRSDWNAAKERPGVRGLQGLFCGHLEKGT